MPKLRTPSQKMLKFKEAYLSNGGNGIEAARTAEYNGNDDTLKAIASENLTKPYFIAELERRRAEIEAKTDKIIMSKSDLLELWTKVAANTDATLADRLRASEDIAKNYGMFVEVSTSLEQQQQLERVSEQEAAHLRRIAAIRIEEITKAG